MFSPHSDIEKFIVVKDKRTNRPLVILVGIFFLFLIGLFLAGIIGASVIYVNSQVTTTTPSTTSTTKQVTTVSTTSTTTQAVVVVASTGCTRNSDCTGYASGTVECQAGSCACKGPSYVWVYDSTSQRCKIKCGFYCTSASSCLSGACSASACSSC